MIPKQLFSILVFTGFSLCFFEGLQNKVSEEPNNHLYLWSHNDYEQERPLHAALELGFQMIEVDIHLINGELYVTHDHPENLNETPLFENLYLSPLTKYIDQNNGQVYPEEALPFYLIIDIKTEAEQTYEALINSVEPYNDYFYRKENNQWIDGPIRLLISGNRPVLDASLPNRIAFLDGRIPNLGNGLSSDLYPLISANWSEYFTWSGNGNISTEELEKLQKYVSIAHKESKLLRFWGTKDTENVWRTLIDNGVDVINVDDIEGLNRFLK